MGNFLNGRILRAGLLGGVAIASLHADLVFAQNASSSEGANASGDVIVVTARRREENIQDVPTAVVAFGAAQLAERSITSLEDLQSSVPGLTLRQTEGNNDLTYSIRGQSVDSYTGSPSAVVPYINEIQLQGKGGVAFYDMESIQVLKGPQGTLFGRNATGGAVLYGTAKPTNEFGGYGKVSAGNYGLLEAQGALNVPIIDEKVLMRVAFNLSRRHGYQHNIWNDTMIGASKTKSGRLSLTIKPDDSFTSTTVAEYTKTGGTNTSPVLYSAYARNPDGTVPLGPDGVSPLNTLGTDFFGPGGIGQANWDAFIDGNPTILLADPGIKQHGLAGYIAARKNAPFYEVSTPSHTNAHRGESYFISNNTTYEASPNLTVKNIIGYFHDKARDEAGEIGAPFRLIDTSDYNHGIYGNRLTTTAFSEELQLQGKAFDDALTYIVGLYYQHTKTLTKYPQTYFDFYPAFPGHGSSVVSNYLRKNTTKAIFAQLTYDLSNAGLQGVSVTGGYRETWDKVSLLHLPGGINSGYLSNPNGQTNKFKKPSWEVGLQYKPSSNVLAYVKGRGSWRSGGFNGDAPPVEGTASTIPPGSIFLPETVKDVEAGLKLSPTLFGRPAHFNVAVYKQWIKGVQRSQFPFCPSSICTNIPPPGSSIAITINVPSAEVKGVEVDFAFKPAEWLTIGGGGALTDAKYKKNTALVLGTTYKFGPYADTAKYTGSIYAKIDLPIPEEMGRMSLRGDLYAQSSQYFANNADTISPGTKLPSYKIFNARLDWKEVAGTPITASLLAKNLFNEHYYTGGLALFAAFGTNAAAIGRPRMWAAELRVDF